MLRPQVAPWILVGDTIADRPLPYAPGLAEGTLFHDTATGDCSVLVVYPETNAQAWEGFCTGASGSSGAGGGALLKWHGGNTSGNSVSVGPKYYLTDDALYVNIISPAPAYPVATTRTPSNLAVNITQNPSGQTLGVFLVVNGVSTSLGIEGVTGIFVATGPGPEILPGETIDLAFTIMAGGSPTTDVIAISATLEL